MTARLAVSAQMVNRFVLAVVACQIGQDQSAVRAEKNVANRTFTSIDALDAPLFLISIN
jgi:hypothetical protein